MSQENFKEVEIVTQRIDDQFFQNNSRKNEKGSGDNNEQGKENSIEDQGSKGKEKHSKDDRSQPDSQHEKDQNLSQNQKSNQQKRYSTHTDGRKSNFNKLGEIQQIGENPQKSQALKDDKMQDEEQIDIFDIPDQKIAIKHPRLLEFLESNYFQFYITFITVYALFGDDFRVMATTKAADVFFDVFTSISLFSFSVEIIVAVYAKDDYIFGFFFWLDVISTLSLILDIQVVSQAIFYSGAGAQTAQLAKAGKASRVGTRAGRIVRLVRLIRIVKLYKAASEEKKDDDDVDTALKKYLEQKEKKKKVHPSIKQDNQDYQDNMNQDNSDEKPNKKDKKSQITQGVFKESRVSKRLSDLTTRRVIIIVLMLLFIMPLFSSDYYYDQPTAIDFAMQNFKTMSETTLSYYELQMFFLYIIEVLGDQYINSPIVFFNTPFKEMNYQSTNFDNLRQDEKQLSTIGLDIPTFVRNHQNETIVNAYLNTIYYEGISSDEVAIQIYGALNIRPQNVVTAGLSLGRTIFVCIVLTLGALAFTNDANDLALGPIERMINKVNKIARNPISAKEQELIKEDGGEDQYETVIIENAIIKIGSLLALGFGDAGSEIIGSNMAKNGDVDPMIPGKKKCAIYGFCDIRNFTDATEQLQEDVMLFVNNIGDIVHSIVDRFGGAANKNIGDAFLMVWKIDKQYYKIEDVTNNITYSDPRYIEILCDFAVISYMKIQAKLNREPKILKYRLDTRLTSRIPGYKVKMGYGLHIGWGIEGAIGSEFKIDASYLSPNVNMSSKLEEKSKQYGTPLLISEALYTLCTNEMKKYMRQVDRIKEKGVDPFSLYTVDMRTDGLPESKDPSIYEKEISKKARVEIEKFKKLDMLDYLDHENATIEWSAENYIQSNKDLKLIMQDWDEEFIKMFSEGYQFYLNGDWQQSKSKLDQCRKTHPDDGPIHNLYEVMGEYNFKAPQDWPGYKEY